MEIVFIVLAGALTVYFGFRLYARWRMVHAWQDLNDTIRLHRDHAFRVEMWEVSRTVFTDPDRSDWDKYKTFREARDRVSDLNWNELDHFLGVKRIPVPGLR